MSCPICAKDTNPTFRPFCSKRCADLDLARWLGGKYVLPGQEPVEDVPQDAPEEGKTEQKH